VNGFSIGVAVPGDSSCRTLLPRIEEELGIESFFQEIFPESMN